MKRLLAAATLLAAVATSQSVQAQSRNAECKPEWKKCVCVGKPFGGGNLHCFDDKIASSPSGGTGGSDAAGDRTIRTGATDRSHTRSDRSAGVGAPILNGIVLNGIHFNSIYLNSIYLNGFALNSFTLNGLRDNGTAPVPASANPFLGLDTRPLGR